MFIRKLIKNKYFIADASIFLFTTPIGLLLLFDGNIKEIADRFLVVLFITIIFALVKLAVIKFFGLYRRVWQYANLNDLLDLALALAISVIIQSLVFEGLRYLPIVSWLAINRLPKSLLLIDSLLSLVTLMAYRYGVRAYLQNQKEKRSSPNNVTRILVVGAGDAGISVVRQMQIDVKYGMTPIAFIDDDPKKNNKNILGLNVVGDRNHIAIACDALAIDKVIIAIPSAFGSDIREIVNICKKNNLSVSTLPSLSEILRKDAGVQLNSIREVQIEDLLRRQPIKTDLQKVSEFVHGKRILVTGAGGSIGSEICRQILRFNPTEIMLLGKGENSIFLIHQELKKLISAMSRNASKAKPPKLHTFICDIRSSDRLNYAFSSFRPEVIFHAAAHKHVPLMELNPPEAITTNVFGTKNLIDLSLHYQVQNFVMISTDKVVNPTNVMGATKRVAEMVVLQAAKNSNKSYTVVRFGNVLGSRGSVVPSFKRQIAEGGPVTITHPDIIRYFMTIPEAVQLVLQTAVLGRGGEVCMLDMGEPVKILDLATDLIQLSGYEVGKDIHIIYTGLRPGEKLFEELFIPGERYELTEHEKVRVVKNASEHLPPLLNIVIDKLGKAAEINDSLSICRLLETIVFGYTSSLLYEKSSQKSLNNLSSSNSSVNISNLEKLYNVGNNTNNDRSVNESIFVAEDFREAIANQQFRLFYQPIVNLNTKETIGFEALLRWQNADGRIIYPIEFLADLEKTGLIVPVGWWGIGEIFQHLSVWQQQFPDKHIDISINLSEQQFFHADLIPVIDELIQEHKIDSDSFGVEIPSSIIRDFEIKEIDKILLQLKALGVRLQLDQINVDNMFLTDLDRLSEFYSRFNRFKIHQEIAQKANLNGNLLQNFSQKAEALGIDVIALGVENIEQSAKWRSLNCKYGQGYLFARPTLV